MVLPAVKQRIRAIKNIGKITKAMKMVAASKMRNAQVAVEQSRGIVEPFVRLFGDHPGKEAHANARAAPFAVVLLLSLPGKEVVYLLECKHATPVYKPGVKVK